MDILPIKLQPLININISLPQPDNGVQLFCRIHHDKAFPSKSVKGL